MAQWKAKTGDYAKLFRSYADRYAADGGHPAEAREFSNFSSAFEDVTNSQTDAEFITATLRLCGQENIAAAPDVARVFFSLAAAPSAGLDQQATSKAIAAFFVDFPGWCERMQYAMTR